MVQNDVSENQKFGKPTENLLRFSVFFLPWLEGDSIRTWVDETVLLWLHLRLAIGDQFTKEGKFLPIPQIEVQDLTSKKILWSPGLNMDPLSEGRRGTDGNLEIRNMTASAPSRRKNSGEATFYEEKTGQGNPRPLDWGTRGNVCCWLGRERGWSILVLLNNSFDTYSTHRVLCLIFLQGLESR